MAEQARAVVPSNDYSWRVAVNTPRTWRERLAHRLHVLAERIDGRVSIAVTVESTPPLSKPQVQAAVSSTFKGLCLAIDSTVHADALEGLMKHYRPDLYQDQRRG